MERRLAAIVAADVVGYSRLVRNDEEGTIAALKSLRKNVIEPVISEHRGRVVKLMGDGFLVEFQSAVDAVKCAVAWQKNLAAQDGDNTLAFRIGINLGDIVIEGDDILGDGVNIAARLEGLAEPGGIIISDMVHQNVRSKLGFAFDQHGTHVLKNIDEPIPVWKWTDGLQKTGGTSVLPLLPKAPSIAVMPFKNLSGDPDDELLCSGIVEDVVTALSKIDRLFVVARNSTSSYGQQQADLPKVGREQGVRYVLTGSLRKSGDHVRISVQLTDTESGRQIVAERYDRELADIFALQDEITREITTSLQIQLTDGEQARLWASGTKDYEAWALCFQAAELIDKHLREETAKAHTLLERAVAIDPDYATAWCKIGWVHWSNARHHWVRDVAGARMAARKVGLRALEIDPESAEAYSLLAMTAMQEGNFEEAEKFAEEGVDRATGQAFVLASLAMVLVHSGNPKLAITLIQKAIELCPIYPSWFRVNLGRAYYLIGDMGRAIEQFRNLYNAHPASVNPILLIAALHDAGRRDEAEQLLSSAMIESPGLTISDWARDQSYKDPNVVKHVSRVMRELGMPE